MMEELEDHEAGGQDDGDAVDHDDDAGQVLPPDPSVKADDQETKPTSNILATVGDTLINIVKVAAKKLTGVIKDDTNLTSDTLGVSTVAPSSGIVSSMTSKDQDTKPSIVTLIPSDDTDDEIPDLKHENQTSNATSPPSDSKTTGGPETKNDKTTFYDKVDSDDSKGSKTATAFTSCELLVRMLGHSSFGCMMGKVLYSKRKHGGFTPREKAPRQNPSARNVAVAPGSDSKPDTNNSKGKEKEGEKESEKVEEKRKKNEKKEVDYENEKKPVVQKDEIISEDMNGLSEKESSIEPEGSHDIQKVHDGIQNVQTSVVRPIDPASIVQPSKVEPSIIQPCHPESEEKGTPLLTSVSVLTTQPSGENTGSTSTKATSSDAEPTLNKIENSNDKLSESKAPTTIKEVSQNATVIKDEININENTRVEDDVMATPVESVVTKKVEPEIVSPTSSTVEKSSSGSKDTCASVESFDNSLIKPSQSLPSECTAPTVVTHPKDVDVLEFKILDSAGREGTAHPEKPGIPVKPDMPVKPDKPVTPDKPGEIEEPVKETKEQGEVKQSDSGSQSDVEPSSIQDTREDKESSSHKVEAAVTASSLSSVVEPSKPDVVAIPSTPTEPPVPETPTHLPDIEASSPPESISPLPAPPVDDVPVAPPSSSIEASLADDLSSVLSKASSSAGGQGLGSSGAQKESIFMRLTNRIKALEQNLTLSTLYMEKLNQK
jgi:hypothetical protein